MGPAMASRRESREERKGEKERTDAMWGMWRNVCVWDHGYHRNERRYAGLKWVWVITNILISTEPC